ncbi:MAG: hypothetical protein Rhirs2KO_03500 [Rhizobiaceae bacterium]
MRRSKQATTLVAATLLGAVAALAIAGGSSDASTSLPEKMPAPASKPPVGDIVAAVEKVPSPRPSRTTIEPKLMTGGLPGSEHACRARLIALGVSFEPLPEIDDEGECGIAYPIEVTSLGKDVELRPEGIMNCETAEAAARLIADTAQPTALSAFGARIESVRHASAYICRFRASGKKISEHAKGNALDISAFVLQNGRIVEVREHEPHEKAERLFQKTVRKAACGPFKTVLGPGTDSDHATHFHLDLAERRSGSTYCR